jgi:hypothetical protein
MFPQPAGEAVQFINAKTAARMLMKVSQKQNDISAYIGPGVGALFKEG